MSKTIYDYIIIGAGYGGLTTASLLKKQGHKVLILESHSKIGGCASNFYRSNREFSFDVGATTISGFDSPKPLGRALDKLGLKEKAKKHLKKLDIGMKVFYEDEVISRYSNQEKWLEENRRVFKDEQIIKLWKKIFKDEKLAWQLLAQNENLVPDRVSEWLKTICLTNPLLNMQGLKFLPYLVQPFSKMLSDYSIQNQDFINFVDEQLLITTQSTHKVAPILSAIMGLNYPEEVYYPLGSIKNLGELMLEDYKTRAGEVLMRHKVESIDKEGDLYLLKVREFNKELKKEIEKEIFAKAVISNAPIWSLRNMVNIDSCKKKLEAQCTQNPDAWGAFTVYFAAKLKLDLGTHYLQIHSNDEIPNSGSKSIFVTVSDSEAKDRAPEGWTSFTVSTHTEAKQWFNFSEAQYKQEKARTQDFILDLIYEALPELRAAEKLAITSGTPHSFEHYTKREYGYVGGIAHDYRKPLIMMPGQRFSEEKIYLVGDSSFPGQGIAAVAYSGMSLVSKLN